LLISEPHGRSLHRPIRVEQLLHILKQRCDDAAFLARLTDIKKEIDRQAAPIRKLRNRTVGHLDLKSALSAAEPLPDVRTEEVVKILALLARFLNEINGYCATAQMDYVPVLSGPPRNLVHILQNFERYQEAWFEKERKRIL
jgi:hypothetical protein